MFSNIESCIASLSSLSMFGLPLWGLSIITVATAAIVAFAIMGIMAQIEKRGK